MSSIGKFQVVQNAHAMARSSIIIAISVVNFVEPSLLHHDTEGALSFCNHKLKYKVFVSVPLVMMFYNTSSKGSNIVLYFPSISTLTFYHKFGHIKLVSHSLTQDKIH